MRATLAALCGVLCGVVTHCAVMRMCYIRQGGRAGSGVGFAGTRMQRRFDRLTRPGVLTQVPHCSDMPYILVMNRIVRVPNSQQRSRKKFLRLCRRMVLCRSGQPSTPGCQLTHSSCCVVAHTTIRSSHRGTVEYSLESVVVSQGKDGGVGHWSTRVDCTAAGPAPLPRCAVVGIRFCRLVAVHGTRFVPVASWPIATCDLSNVAVLLLSTNWD